MKKRQITLLLVALFLLTFGFYALAKSFQDRMVDFPIKALTEEKLSALLGATVSVQQIKFGLVRQVSLAGLQIQSDNSQKDNFYLASAKAISFQYNLLNLLRRDFKNPNRVTVDSPQLLFRSFQLPEKLFQKNTLGKSGDFLNRSFQLAVKGGKAEYPLLDNKYRIGLQNIDGTLIPVGKDSIRTDLKAQGAGVVRGDLVIKGNIFPAQKSYDLNVQFKQGGEIFLPSFMKLKKIEGTFHIQPNKISFNKVRFRIADLLFEARGEILDFESKKPIIHLWFKLLLEKFPQSAEIHLNFKTEEISGVIQSLGQQYPFNGLLFLEDSSVRIAEMKILDAFQLSADLNLKANSFQFSLEKDPFRLNANFSFDNWDIVSTINLEHLLVQDIDVVTFLKLRLTPTEEFKNEKKWQFLGSLKTDYLIFNTEPVNDLEGTFQIERFAVQKLKLNWGPKYLLTGAYDPLAPKKTAITLQLGSVDLGALKRLVFYAKPKRFEGTALGKIELSGDLKNPLISGNIEVNDGMVGEFNYKAAYLKFSGYYPYLRLADSKIVKGKSPLYLKGDLNLNAANIFQDLQVMSEDHIVLWRGVILSENLNDNLVMIGEKLKRKLTE